MNLFMAEQAGQLAEKVDAAFLFIFLVGLFFFIVTQGALIWFAIRYRRREKDQESETPYITGNRTLEIVWVAVPSILLLAIFFYGYLVFRDIRTPPPGAAEINVTAKQWLYVFKHPDGRSELNEVHVPVGKAVKFIMTSPDVIHGFYLPEFRVKQDIVPGSYNYLWVAPDRPGRFDIYCTQYCGTGHSTMRAVMVAMTPEDYEHWSGAEEKPEALSPVKRGEEAVEHSGCLACHSLDGTAKIGPTFKGLFGRTVALADGKSVDADENYVRESIVDPTAKIVKGFQPVMPSYKGIVKDDDITAIIAYLKTLK
jgi:cytochrome c oxidase subunit II